MWPVFTHSQKEPELKYKKGRYINLEAKEIHNQGRVLMTLFQNLHETKKAK